MSPRLEPGDDVLVRKTRRVSVGEVVVATHPFQSHTFLIKRVHAVDGSGSVDLRGDNGSASSDSRTLGMFKPSQLVGCVTCYL